MGGPVASNNQGRKAFDVGIPGLSHRGPSALERDVDLESGVRSDPRLELDQRTPRFNPMSERAVGALRPSMVRHIR